MISHLAIKGLYDLYDYEISFTEGELKIITGPNGYGKTTILRIVNNLIGRKFWWFYFLMFRDIIIDFTDGTHVIINREASKELEKGEQDYTGSNNNIKVTFDYFIPEIGQETFIIGRNTIIKIFRLIGRRIFRASDNINEEIDYEEVISQYQYDDIDEAMPENALELYNYLKKKKCVLISEQRAKFSHIHRRGPESYEQINYAIESIKNELKEIYLQTQAEFARKSQDVDASFVKHLFAIKKGYTEKEYNQRAMVLQRLIKNIQSYGLAKDLNINYSYNQKYSEALKVYIDGMIDKMNVYLTLYMQMSLFDALVNKKGLSNKEMKIGGDEIIKIIDRKGKVVPLRKLSSGEQNLIILYYDLIFKSKSGNLLLIDEPENSMHNAWLIDMLEDYEHMAEMNKLQIIFATHSSVFINGNYELTYDLYKDGRQTE